MNLPPDKARLLRQYDNEKKWDLICDQVRPWTLVHTPAVFTSLILHQHSDFSTQNDNAVSVVRLQERFQVKNPPHTYIQKLRGYLDPGVTRKVGQWPFKYNVHLKENSADFTHQRGFAGLGDCFYIREKNVYTAFCGPQKELL